jgi:dolichol-phosphate mannosyltransferase
MEALCNAEGHTMECYEIIIIDDGSTDRSWQIIKEIHTTDARVKGICFSRNFGHHSAITAGLDESRGNIVIIMDGDLQDPPEEIHKLYSKFTEGYDLVYGIRQERQDSFFKKITSLMFWWILRSFSGVDMPANQTMLRMLSRRMVDTLKNMR